MHSGLFRCLTKVGAKWAELVQKFVPRNHVELFATNAPNPPHCTLNWHFCVFHTICVHSGPFGCLTKLGAKRGELVQKFVPRSSVRIFRNELIRSTPLHRKLTFWCVSYYLGAFGPFGCLTKLGHNECTQSTPLDHKLTFWCVSYYFCAFVTVWLPYETRCNTCRCSAKVCAMKLCRNFSQRTHPIHPIAP